MHLSCRLRTLAVPALLAAALAGCADDPAAVYSVEGELVGGTATTVRAELGVFSYPTGPTTVNRCSATLIGPRTVLTAAHCLAPAYTGTAAPAGAVFMFTDLGGEPQTYPVDRVHSFATKRGEMVPGTPFTTDLAILHLSRSVPATEAVPATLALQEPSSGALSTIFGFGCQDRTPGPDGGGGGFKQFLTFTYPNATTALCFGDSGGPVVFGGEAGGGPIWGVNSDYNPGWDALGWFFDSWTDLFADVPFYRRQIESVVRGWDGSDEAGVNRPGLDYSNELVFNVNSCRTSCQNDANCRAFTFVPEGTQGRCWKKVGVPEPVPGPGMTSGIARRLETNTGRIGGDYHTLAAASADECAGACGRDPQCVAFTYFSGTCQKKNWAPPTSYCGGCTSGVPRRRFEAGVNRPGFDLAVHTVVSTRECERLCIEHERCESYTHTSAASNNCWLKDAVPDAAPVANMTSGVRRGLETNTNRWGMDYRSFTHPPSPAICQATCARESQCQAWTYVPPPASGNDATCWLKSGVPASSAATGLVSGVKGLEMIN